MDGISFDSLTYLSDDSFVIECSDDFGGICEEIVRLASTSSHFVDQLEGAAGSSLDDVMIPSDSPPSSTYYSSARCFDKEMPSLFSDMEYLTEVSPETEMVIGPTKNAPVIVNPSEFSWVRKEASPEQKTEVAEEVPFPTTQATVPESSNSGNRYISSTNYRTILQNYIQKGKRKLEASSYSKMKATVMSVKSGANSTSLIETVTCASFDSNPPPHSTANGSQHCPENSQLQPETATAAIPMPISYRCPDCNSCFLSVERLRKHTCIITEQYQCQLCRREFRKRKTLEQHIKSHDKVFSTDDDLRKW